MDTVSFDMVFVKGDTFIMGATIGQKDSFHNAVPMHYVTLGDYYIGKYEVTQALWQAVMDNNPSCFKGENLPVENVSWNDVQEFIKKLNQKTGERFRLPTEAEWEYAARGGNKTCGYRYSGDNDLSLVGWYNDTEDQTHEVGCLYSNELGLFDMSGNVWEWCQDWDGSYSSEHQINPTGPKDGLYHICRGGSWNHVAECCQVASRPTFSVDGPSNTRGLRLVLVK